MMNINENEILVAQENWGKGIVEIGDQYSKNLDYESYMPVSLGTTISGEYLKKDLNTLPNLLIAGIPGSGKSMLLHSIILSLMKV